MAPEADKPGTRPAGRAGHYVVGQFLGIEAEKAYADRKGNVKTPVSVKVVAGNELIMVRFNGGEADVRKAIDGAQLLAEVSLKCRVNARAFGDRVAVFYEGVVD